MTPDAKPTEMEAVYDPSPLRAYYDMSWVWEQIRREQLQWMQRLWGGADLQDDVPLIVAA